MAVAAHVRLRFRGIEVAVDELSRAFEPATRERILEAGKAHGFRFVTLDLAGYQVGSHNAVLVGKSLRVLA